MRLGRQTFANTLKYVFITTSANFGNMVSMALATPLLPFLPLVAKQILLNNFLSDLPSIAISTDNVDADRVTVLQVQPDSLVHLTQLVGDHRMARGIRANQSAQPTERVENPARIGR